MGHGRVLSRARGAIGIAAVAATAGLFLAAESPLPPPACGVAPVHLSPQYAADVPGAVDPVAATEHLLASTDGTIEVADLRTDWTLEVVESRPGSAVVLVSDPDDVVRGLAMTIAHPAGGWQVDLLQTCVSGPS